MTASSNPNSKTVANHIVPVSSAITFNLIGTFYWKAVYAGDANNNGNSSPCVPLSVEKSTGTMTLAITPTISPMKAGGTATARGTITSATSTASGSIVYTVYSDSACTAVLTATGNPSTKTVTNRSAGTSAKITIPVAGTVYWRAVYGGDANNEGESSACVELTVTGGSLTASIASAQLSPVAYSTTERSNTGVLVLTVTDQRGTADGWSVSLSVSDFTYSGVSPVAADIPAASFSITSAQGPTVVRGQVINPTDGPYVPSSGATGPLDETLVVLVAEPGAGAGEYQQSLNVTLVIPAESQSGTYTAVIQTTTSSAPLGHRSAIRRVSPTRSSPRRFSWPIPFALPDM